MKKNDLLKVLGITFLVVLLFSWVIPAGVYSSGKFQSLGEISPIGLYELLSTPVITIASFIQFGLVFLAIGALYGVLNKTEAYQVLVDGIVSKWDKNKKKFLIITMINFILLSSIIGVSNLIFVLVPFFVTVLLKLNYSKMTTFASTVGSLLLGQSASLFSSEIWGYLKVYFGVNLGDFIFARIIFLLMVLILFILFVTKNDSKNKNEDKIIPLYEDKKSKKSPLTLIILLAVVFAVSFIGFYNWNYTFDITMFDSLYESITTAEIAGQPIIAKFLGGFSQIGYWTDLDLIIILLVTSLIVAWVYNVKKEDTIEGIKDGVKQMLLPAFYALLSFMVFTVLYNMSNGNFVMTIVDKFISASDDFSILGTVGSTLVASTTYSYFPVLLNALNGVFSLYDTAVLPIITFLFQSIYGVVMMVAPTSVILLAGLSYLNIPYKEWIKYIWKFALTVFAVIIVIAFILSI